MFHRFVNVCVQFGVVSFMVVFNDGVGLFYVFFSCSHVSPCVFSTIALSFFIFPCLPCFLCFSLFLLVWAGPWCMLLGLWCIFVWFLYCFPCFVVFHLFAWAQTPPKPGQIMKNKEYKQKTNDLHQSQRQRHPGPAQTRTNKSNTRRSLNT